MFFLIDYENRGGGDFHCPPIFLWFCSWLFGFSCIIWVKLCQGEQWTSEMGAFASLCLKLKKVNLTSDLYFRPALAHLIINEIKKRLRVSDSDATWCRWLSIRNHSNIKNIILFHLWAFVVYLSLRWKISRKST